MTSITGNAKFLRPDYLDVIDEGAACLLELVMYVDKTNKTLSTFKKRTDLVITQDKTGRLFIHANNVELDDNESPPTDHPDTVYLGTYFRHIDSNEYRVTKVLFDEYNAYLEGLLDMNSYLGQYDNGVFTVAQNVDYIDGIQQKIKSRVKQRLKYMANQYIENDTDSW